MIDTLRRADAGSARYETPFPEAGVTHMVYRWPEHIDAALERDIVALVRHTSAAAPIIGFAEEISDDEAGRYLHELRGNLAARKCRLLTIVASTGQLVGLCTLRRNLNPNNRHITDLAKGMIREEFRGGEVLPAAFHEIALQCEADAVELVTLDVRADTPAFHVWRRFGFLTYGVLPDYARSHGMTHAGHFMMQAVADLKQHAIAALEARARRRSSGAAQPA
jgi:hypothetical protein